MPKFNWHYTWDSDYGLEYTESYDECELSEAVEEIKGHEDEARIETAIKGVTVFEDGEWLMSREEAEALAAEEEATEEARKAEKEAAAAAEAAAFGDAIDKANIAFIMSIANKYPAKDSGARYTAEEIAENKNWKDKRQSWRPTESDVIHIESGREYHIDMWRGERKVTRTHLMH